MVIRDTFTYAVLWMKTRLHVRSFGVDGPRVWSMLSALLYLLKAHVFD